LQLLIADVDDVVGRLCKTASVGLFVDFLFFDLADSVVVVQAPDSLFVVAYVAVVVSALCRSVVDADTVQVIGHRLVGRVLVLKQVLLPFNLLPEIADLLFDLRAVRAKDLLDDA